MRKQGLGGRSSWRRSQDRPPHTGPGLSISNSASRLYRFARSYHTAGMIIAEDASPSQLVAIAVEVASMKEI